MGRRVQHRASMDTVAYLCIGDEILSGKIRDANGYSLSTSLFAHGVRLERIEVLPDVVSVIAERVRHWVGEVDHVVTSGGIGPTHDDVTYEAVAAGYGVGVEAHPELLQRMQEHYDARGIELNAARKKMAMLPAGAEVIMGEGNWVPVVKMKQVFVLPGIPKLFDLLLPRVIEQMTGGTLERRLLFTMRGEGDIAAVLSATQAAFPDVAIGSYPRYDEPDYRVMVTFDGTDAARVEAAAARVKGPIDGFERDSD